MVKHYDEIYNIVAKYDPAEIAWASKDEYKSEVIEIANRAIVLSEEKLAEYIYEVFKFWFGESVIKTDMQIYKKMAAEIKTITNPK